MEPVLNDVIRQHKMETILKVSKEPLPEPAPVKKEMRIGIIGHGVILARTLAGVVKNTYESITHEVKESISKGETLSEPTFLPDPEVKVLKAKGYTSIYRGHTIFAFNHSTMMLKKAQIEELEVEDERGKGKRKVVIEEDGYVYFSALCERTAKEKVGLA